MTVRSAYRSRVSRRWSVAALVAACVVVGALVGVLILPQYFSNAATTGVSTIYKTATNMVDGSVAASSDAPGGAKTGTAKPGDTIKWVVSYQNNTSAPASVNLKDVITNAGTYVNGSLKLPPNLNSVGTLSPQYSTDAGASWATGTPPANANGLGFTGTIVPQGAQQLSVRFPSPTSSSVATNGGDAYNVVVKGNLIYAVYHHRNNPVVFCAQMNGTTCPGWPTNSNVQSWSSTVGTPIGTGTAFTGQSAWQNGTWISGNKLYWFTGQPDASSAGTACLDLSKATPVSCGYTALAPNQTSNFQNGAQIGSTGLLASNGNIYAVTVSGGKNVIVCVNPSTGAACGTIALNSGVTDPYTLGGAVFGSYVFASVQQTTSSSWQTYCYVAGGSLCPGSWPVNTSTSVAWAPTPFAPILSTSGALTGICTITNGSGTSSNCWNLSGTSVANPYTGINANYNAAGNAAGDTFQLGTKVYGSASGTIFCVDFATWSGTGQVPRCAGFVGQYNAANYTVRSASDVAPNCLVATGDGGGILFFNAITGGGCTGVSGPTTMTVTPSTYYCGSGSAGFKGWGSLSLPGLVAGTFSNVTLTLKDQNGVVISGFNGITISGTSPISLAAIPTTVTAISATVTVNGVNDPSGVASGQIAISWSGLPPELCFQTLAPAAACDAVAPVMASNTANAVTTSAAGSDAPGGNTTGAAQFAVRAVASQCSLSIKKTSPVQTARPGDKVTYSITVQNTGTQAYNSAAFTDDLTDVLKEATFNGDQAASSGTATYTAPTLAWSGGVAAGATATVTYSVTVKSPDAGDHSLLNTVVSPTVGSNCAAGSTDPLCTVTVKVQVTDVLWNKIDATPSKNILAGAAWTFTPVDGSGKPTGPAITVTDCQAATASACTGADIDPIGGQFRLTNLGPGTYQLVETQAPVGFKLNPTPIPVTLTSAANSFNLPDVVNKQMPVPTIPLTGGLGTDALTITGGSLLAGVLGLVIWQYIRRRRTA